MQNIKKLKEIIQNSNNIIVFTGAGISCPSPSNIPDFRSDNGLYNEKLNMKYRPEEIISSSFFWGHTNEFFDYYFKSLLYFIGRYFLLHINLIYFVYI